MHTDLRPTWLGVFAVGLALGLTPGPALAQEAARVSLLLIDSETRIESVRFRFDERAGLERKRLRDNTALKGGGRLKGLRRAFDFLPGVSAPELDRFNPLVLQKDVVRLRRLYQRSGYPEASIDYDVVLDSTTNRVRVTFLIDEGPPLLLDSVTVGLRLGASETIESDPAVLPEPASTEWPGLLRRLNSGREQRFGEQERARLQTLTTEWFGGRGYPWATVTVEASDTVDSSVRVGLVADPGPRATVDEVTFEGQRRLSDPVLRREVPLDVGDVYDVRGIWSGQTELYELPIISRALGDLPEQARDSTVSVRFRVEEARPRLVWGRVGWRSESGVAGEVHWSHRDFLGGARTVTVSTIVETGWGAIEQARGRSVGVSVLARQPYVAHRSMSATLGPFVRYRDDFRDRSLLFGVESGLIYRVRPLETLTLQHELSRLRVDDGFQLLPIAELVQSGDSAFAPVFVRSVFRLSGSFGRFDNRLDPRRGFLIEPRVEVTGPTGVTDIEFFRVGLDAVLAAPLNESFGFFLRASAGRLVPFGDSDPDAGSSRTRSIVGLRGAMFTAGGTSDVRGWGRGLVGSKIPEVVVDGQGLVSSVRFLPVGGLKRLTGSAELVMPFPFLPPQHRTYLFFDSGRVWSADERFQPGDPELVNERWAHAVGGGLEFGTLVGPIRISAGYKLNPTRVDLLSPGQVARDLAGGGDLSSLETSSLRRWHLHFSIGRSL